MSNYRVVAHEGIEHKATMIRALKAAIVNVVKGDVEGARELLKGVCPP